MPDRLRLLPQNRVGGRTSHPPANPNLSCDATELKCAPRRALARSIAVPSRFAPVNPRVATGATTVDQSFEDRLEHAIIQRINTDRYNLWFRGHTKFVLLDDSLIVGVPNLMCQEWLQKT